MGLTVKLTFWNSLPWHLAGIAHHNVELAREIGRQCLFLFDGLSSAARLQQHHLTRRFCDPEFAGMDDGPALRPELEQFVHGADLATSELRNISPWVVALALLRIEERSLEATHKDVQFMIDRAHLKICHLYDGVSNLIDAHQPHVLELCRLPLANFSLCIM